MRSVAPAAWNDDVLFMANEKVPPTLTVAPAPALNEQVDPRFSEPATVNFDVGSATLTAAYWAEMTLPSVIVPPAVTSKYV